ncbi:hypothetical protein GJ629_03515 [Halapricum sp. CBA1109]|uniref:DUF192 domain-containing protein n=1 Tax=Halapricum sp. CBA1109 TaxID=2668068 RepID=UPI0012FC6303|nr:DUF192 domain-containing protein [Halapricum sp. CBA1109]MUV89084.1 hypothetical protein [Halapricum sp. CBA1109]
MKIDVQSYRKSMLFVVLASSGIVLILYSCGGLDETSPDPYPDQDSVILTGDPQGSVTFYSDGGIQVQTVSVWVAETPGEKYEGLSNTSRDDLPLHTGLLFPYQTQQERSFVMRAMNYPLEIVFIAENGTVTRVFEAEVAAPGMSNQDLERYTAEAQYVLEVRQGTLNSSVERGSRTEILFPPSG